MLKSNSNRGSGAFRPQGLAAAGRLDPGRAGSGIACSFDSGTEHHHSAARQRAGPARRMENRFRRSPRSGGSGIPEAGFLHLARLRQRGIRQRGQPVRGVFQVPPKRLWSAFSVGLLAGQRLAGPGENHHQFRCPGRAAGIPVNKFVLEKAGQHILVLYWYQNDRNVWAEEFQGKLRLLPDLIQVQAIRREPGPHRRAGTRRRCRPGARRVQAIHQVDFSVPSPRISAGRTKRRPAFLCEWSI